ncbi:MAG TPA: PAS domain S-box protein, partial [Pyrinomonadaceae bacterium]|nr:PAS domain S-box protein [Pyrinomonadaceae bacterium]
EKALLENENKYRTLVEQASDGIHTYDTEGNFIEINTKFCEMLGYTPAELSQLNVKDLLPAEDLIADPIRFDELSAGKTLLRERRLRRKDGTLLPVEISGKMVQDGVLQAIIRDVTNRKNAEERLKQNEQWLRNIFEASHDGILVEENETITYVNKAYIQMFGYDDAQELIGQPVSIIISAGDVERLKEFGKRRLRGEKPLAKYEFKGKRKDGTSIDVEASVSISNVAGHTYITSMIRDITERKRMEMLIEAQKKSLEMVVKGAPLEQILIYLTQVVEQQAEGDVAASILLLDEQGCLRNGASPNLSEDYLRAIDGIKADVNVGTCSAAAASREVVITPDIAADPKWQGLSHLPMKLELKAAWTIPIIARDGNVLGTFGTYFRQRREPTAIERQVVEILGRTAALAIEGKQMEETLRGNENQLRLITDAMPLLVSYVDSKHHYRFVNRTYTEWFEREQEEIIDKHLSEVLGQTAYNAILPQVEKVLAGEEVSFEHLIPYKTGERFIHLHYIPDTDAANGQIRGFYAFVQDITERKRTQEALQRYGEELELRVEERTRELEQANEARVQVLHQLVTVQEDERQRIARDLHDQLGQQLTALRLQLGFLRKICGGDSELEMQVNETQKIARQLDSDVDFLAWQMRPTALDDLGIAAALEHYLQQWSKHFNIPAEFDAKRFGKTPLAPESETNLYRIAQETLNNIYKHA